MLKNFIKNILITLFFGIVVAIIYFLIEINKSSNYSFDKDGFILIKKGYGRQTVMQELIAKNIAESSVFNEYFLGVLESYFGHLKFGEYKFTDGISFFNAVKKIIRSETYQRKFLVVEGETVENVIMHINFAYGLLGDDLDLDIAAEGSILPDTYFYTYGYTKIALLNQMKKQMEIFMERELSKIEMPNYFKDKNDILILSSIVEKEATIQEEKKIIASVYINRIKRNMRLQADPTILYVTKKMTISKSDLFIESPYNTYRKKGLPPTPICNPGKISILAVLYPAKTKYLYFVFTGGKNLFSEDFSEHVIKKLKYRNKM